jgi:metal-sulfur cluster biosynthetic enzyme
VRRLTGTAKPWRPGWRCMLAAEKLHHDLGFVMVESAIGSPPPNEVAVVRALETCFDPCCQERGISVVDMGLVEGVTIHDGHVSIDLVLTSGWCPFVARLYDMIVKDVGALPGVGSVSVTTRWDTPWTPDRMSDTARQKLRLPLEQLLPLREARLKGASA